MDEPYAHLFNLKGYKNPINTLSFSASGEFLATGGEDGVVWIWDPQDGKFVASFDVKSPVLCLEWDPDFRKRLFFGCQDGTVAFVDDFGKNKPAHPIQTGIEGGQVYALTVDDSARYVGISIGPEVHIARKLNTVGTYATFSILPEPAALPEPVVNTDARVRGRSLKFIKNGTRIIVSYLNHGVVCWDIDTSRKLWRIVPTHENRHIGSSMLSPSGQSLLVSNLSNGMNLYSLSTRNLQNTYQYNVNPRTNFPLSLAFLKRGRYVTCGTHTGTVEIWNTETGEIFQSLDHDSPLVTCLATHASKGYEYIATATTGDCPVVKIWRASNKRTASEAIKENIDYWRVMLDENYNEKGSRDLIIGVVVAVGTYFLTRYLLQPIQPDPTLEMRLTTWIPPFAQLFSELLRIIVERWEDIRQILRQTFLEWLDVQPHEVQIAIPEMVDVL